jgi:hypothetical protein
VLQSKDIVCSCPVLALLCVPVMWMGVLYARHARHAAVIVCDNPSASSAFLGELAE